MVKPSSELVCPSCRMLIPLNPGKAAPAFCPHCLAEFPKKHAKEPASRPKIKLPPISPAALLMAFTGMGALLTLLLAIAAWNRLGGKPTPETKAALAPELLGQLEERDRLADTARQRGEALKKALDGALALKPGDKGAVEAWKSVALAAEIPADAADQMIQSLRLSGEKAALEGHLKEKDDKEKKDREGRQAKAAEAMTRGKAALDKGNAQEARVALENARALAPETPGLDKEMAQLLKLENRLFEAANSQIRLKAGQENLKAERWGEALRDFQSVLSVLPDNVEALDGKKIAEKAFEDQEKDREKRLQYLIHLDDGRKALREKRYEDASASFNRAARLMPDEKEPGRMLETVRQTRNEVEKNSQALVAAAKNLLTKGNPQEAFFLLVDADNLTPNDRTIRKMMSEAQQLANRMQGLANPLNNDPKYLYYMAQGRAAMLGKNPIAAVENFENAMRQTNGRDSFALRALMEARSAKDLLGQRVKDYEKALKQGQLLLERKEYGPAILMLDGAARLFPEQKTIDLLDEARFQDLVSRARTSMDRDPDTAEKLADQALRMRPADIGANNLLKQAKARVLGMGNLKLNPVDPYESAMAVGRAAMREKKFGDAVQAFKLALQNKPNDAVAQELEKQARERLVGQEDIPGKKPPGAKGKPDAEKQDKKNG